MYRVRHVQSKLALTDRNMHAKNYLKVVLRSWDYAFFGTTTHFYEMHTVCPPLDPMLVTFSFKNKISIFVQFLSKICLFFLLIPFPYDSINARNDCFLHRINMGWFWCNFKAFATPFEKWIVKILPIVVIIKQSIISSKY